MSYTDYRATKEMDNMENISPASALIGDPSKYGRVAEDGTVYVITGEGEKAVGSYPGKTAEEALAYFVRKFEALASEVALLAARIKSGAMVPSDAHAAVEKLRSQVKNLNGVGNLAALHLSVEQIPALIDEHKAMYEARKAAEAAAKAVKRAEALAAKEKIVAEAEMHALSENWKLTSERLKSLLDEWKKAPRLDKKSDSELWKRFSASRNKFDKRRRQHFAGLLAQQSQVKSAKDAIVTQAEALANSTDWVNTARKYKSLMDQWKASGRGKKSDDAKLWSRFKTAQDTFFAAKNADLEKRQGSMAENLVKREALIVEFEALLPISNLEETKKKFRDLDNQWRKLGPVDRVKRAGLDKRFAVVAQALEEAKQEHFRKTDPAAKARANDVVSQLAEAVANYERQAEKAEAAGNSKKAQEMREAAAARKLWLEEAQKGLSSFTS